MMQAVDNDAEQARRSPESLLPIDVNVGGTVFTLGPKILQRCSHLLQALQEFERRRNGQIAASRQIGTEVVGPAASRDSANALIDAADSAGRAYIDQDAVEFRTLLDFLRNGEVAVADGYALTAQKRLRRMLLAFGAQGGLPQFCVCCRRYLFDADRRDDVPCFTHRAPPAASGIFPCCGGGPNDDGCVASVHSSNGRQFWPDHGLTGTAIPQENGHCVSNGQRDDKADGFRVGECSFLDSPYAPHYPMQLYQKLSLHSTFGPEGRPSWMPCRAGAGPPTAEHQFMANAMATELPVGGSVAPGARIVVDTGVANVFPPKLRKLKRNRHQTADDCDVPSSTAVVPEPQPTLTPDHPRFKTRMCPSFKNGRCLWTSGTCRFAHSFEELRGTEEFFKTQLCAFWSAGHCKAGSACRHAHGPSELRMSRIQKAEIGSVPPLPTRVQNEEPLNANHTSATSLSMPRSVIPIPCGVETHARNCCPPASSGHSYHMSNDTSRASTASTSTDDMLANTITNTGNTAVPVFLSASNEPCYLTAKDGAARSTIHSAEPSNIMTAPTITNVIPASAPWNSPAFDAGDFSSRSRLDTLDYSIESKMNHRSLSLGNEFCSDASTPTDL